MGEEGRSIGYRAAMLMLMLAGALAPALAQAPPSPAPAPSGSVWMAVDEDAIVCLHGAPAELAESAPCVRFSGATRTGAWLGRLVAEQGDSVVLAWERPPTRTCIEGPPHGLVDLGLQADVPREALLPLVTEPASIALDHGGTLALAPGQPLLPAEDHEILVVDLGQARVVADGSVANSDRVSGPPAPPRWPDGRAMDVDPGKLAPWTWLQPSLRPDQKLRADWLDDGGVALADSCARVVLPWDAESPPGRSAAQVMTDVPETDRQATIRKGAVISLPSGHPVGRVEAPFSTGERRLPDGTRLPSAMVTNPQGGRTCFLVPTATQRGVPATEAALELCVPSTTLR